MQVMASSRILSKIFMLAILACLSFDAAADPSSEILGKITPNFRFRQPGTLNSLDELQRIRLNILAGKEPWKSNFEKMQASQPARLTYVPHAVAEVATIGPDGTRETLDAQAAYTHALLWIFTEDPKHAQKAAEIIDAWSSTVKTHTGLNWVLQCGWTPPMLVEAGEILRATYPQWQGAKQLGKMLNDVYMPVLHNRIAFFNREFAVINALVAIGIYNRDRAAFYEGINHWLSYIPSYFYIKEDGPEPKPTNYWLTSPTDRFLAQLDANRLPPGWASWIDAAKKLNDQVDESDGRKKSTATIWNFPATYIPGYTPETGGRDLAHTEAGFAQAVDTAEMAWHQGLDLYSIAAPRWSVFMETTASIRLGEPISDTEYVGGVNPGNGINPTYEIAYNHLHNVMGIELPKTRRLIQTVIRHMGPVIIYRPFPPPFPPELRAGKVIWNQGQGIDNWETLTHAELNAPNQ